MAQPAAYQVVARRYRPQRFADLVGQEHVARGLAGAIESGRIGHAYLFTGARGVGKTSAARIYAKALECGSRQHGEPCNECPKCLAIAGGHDVDVIEVDAASNRGIDEIRQLRQNVAVRPASGQYKTYIIDEVHMLTREAFNALLKTLEEPPPHVKFVLCTTEPEKLPITILSRCQRFDFQAVSAGAITGRLAQIVEAEGVQVAPAALGMIARRAAGSMRDSQSLLEQLLGIAVGDGDEIGIEEVQSLIGIGSEEKIGRLLQAIVSRDAAAALAALDDALSGGADAGGVLEQLLAVLRDCLVASVGCGPEALLAGDGCGVDLAALGRETGTETLLAMLQIVDQSLARMRQSTHATVLAEMAVVRLTSLEDLDSLVEVIDRVAAGESPSVAEKKKPQPAAVAAAPAAEPAREQQAEPAVGTTSAAVPAVGVHKPTAAAAETAVSASVPLPDALKSWNEAGAAVGGIAEDFAAMAVEAVWEGNSLQVELPASGTSASAFLSRPEIVGQFQEALSRVAGRPCRYAVSCRKDEQLPKPAAGGQAAAGGKQTKQATDRSRGRGLSSAALLRETMDHPLVSHARTIFDAAIRKVEPPRRPPPEAVQPAESDSASPSAQEPGDA
jgi:DNA polymerase-3 subunit gamma/tau